jgi:hypothetical protein
MDKEQNKGRQSLSFGLLGTPGTVEVRKQTLNGSLWVSSVARLLWVRWTVVPILYLLFLYSRQDSINRSDYIQ